MFFLMDLKNLIKNKIILITTLFLLIIMIIDPISIFINVLRFDFHNNMYHYWLLMNSANFGGEFFNTLFYIFPIVFTGMIYFNEDKSSVKKMLLIRSKKIKYYISKWLSVIIFVFILFMILLLTNLLLTNVLFLNNPHGVDPMLIPSKTSFAYELFILDPIYVCLFYTFMNALIMALLTGFCVGLHMVVKFPNIYIAMIVPIIIMFVVNFIFDSQALLRSYSINLNRQPAASYAMSVEFSFEHFFTTVGILFVIDILLLIVGLIRNRNVM